MHKKITLRQKVFLVLFGLFFAFAILETGLRIAGFVIMSMQEYSNQRSVKQKDAYCIMCLGESTTAAWVGGYPRQLEEALNQKNTGIKFSVINKGISGTNSKTILELLEDNLNKYKPDMVIAMMGVNDDAPFYQIGPMSSLLRPFKTYKFMMLLKQHILTRIATAKMCKAKDVALNDYKSCVELGDYYRDRGEYDKAVLTYEKAMDIDPSNSKAYFELGWCSMHLGKLDKTEEMFKKAIELDPANMRLYAKLGRYYYIVCKKYKEAEAVLKKAMEANPEDSSICFELGKCYQEQKKYYQSEKLFSRAIDIDKNTKAYFALIWDFIKQGEYDKAEGVLIKAIANNPKAFRFYNLASILYEKMGNSKLAEEYFEKASDPSLNYYTPETQYSYQRLKNILKNKGIRLVCMQYPLRSVKPLMRILEPSEEVVFIENLKIFREVLKKEDYDIYFSDMFAGDFGHFTDKGSRLIAENVAGVILEEVFK